MYNIGKEREKLGELGVTVGVKLRPNSSEKGWGSKLAALELLDLEPAKEGLVLQSSNDTPRAFSLVVAMPISTNLATVIVSGKMSQTVDSLQPVRIGENGRAAFVRNFGTKYVYGGHTTMPFDNSLRVVSVQDGLLQIFSVGVVTRLHRRMEKGAWDHLVVQQMYRARLYRDPASDKIVADGCEIVTSEAEYGGFNRWEAMRKVVREMIPDPSSLPVLTEAQIFANPHRVASFEEGGGVVIFYDVRRGFGFADTIYGPCYFNWREDAGDNNLPFFETGQLIKFDNWRATSYGEQLVGVRGI